MSSVKWELEDLSLRYLEPDIYYDLAEKVKKKKKRKRKDNTRYYIRDRFKFKEK